MPSWHSISSRSENAISESLHFQSVAVTEYARPSLGRTGNAIDQRFLSPLTGRQHLESQPVTVQPLLHATAGGGADWLIVGAQELTHLPATGHALDGEGGALGAQYAVDEGIA